jgi:hypothetical protein
MNGPGGLTTSRRAPMIAFADEQIGGKPPAIHFTICPQAIEIEYLHSGIFTATVTCRTLHIGRDVGASDNAGNCISSGSHRHAMH